jgi:hypothetical protein
MVRRKRIAHCGGPQGERTMDFSIQATLHGASVVSSPKNSLYNAIKDALLLPDLSHIFIDSNDGKVHLSGPEIRTIAQTEEFKVYETALISRGYQRD